MGCDIHSIGQVRKDGKNWMTVIARPGGDHRCYDSFAVMADVRNGSGFAGCDTGAGWPVLFQPRGLPDGLQMDESGERVPLSEPYYWSFDEKKEEPEYELWLGDHSHSWLTLTELHRIFDGFKDQEYEVHGMISEEQRRDLENGIVPDSWCAWTNRKGYVNAKWKVPAQGSLYGLKSIIETLDKVCLENKVTPDDVRLVFGFDN